jgi:iduronate 2-sulfatase
MRNTLIIVVTLIAVFLGGADARAESRPNVLFIAVDDMRTNIGCYGDPIAVTPNIDALASRSVRFDRAYCQFASCNASRTSLLTGMRPDSISVWKLNTDFRHTAPKSITLPQHFKQNGYHTEAIGKVLHNYTLTMRDNALSWSVPARFDKVNHFRDYGLTENLPPPGKLNKTTVAENADVGDDAYADGVIAEDAVETIQRLAGSEQPFFLAVGFLKPHSPYNAPAKYWDLYNRADMRPLGPTDQPDGAPDWNWIYANEIRSFSDIPTDGPISEEMEARMRHGYYAATSYADANIGKLLHALDQSGVAENTIIVLWSDHGYHLGENDHWTKVTVRELDARVPLLVSLPAGNPASTSAIVESIDIYPTLSELCGITPPAQIDGRSFGKVLVEPKSDFRHTALTQVCRPWFSKGAIEQMGYSIRAETYRYTQWVDFNSQEILAEEFYEIEADLLQRENLARNLSSDRLKALRKTMSEARDPAE